MRVVLLTGGAGVGKTTLVKRLSTHYSNLGKTVGGIITLEVRENGQRMGFKITDLSTGIEGWLARKNQSAGPVVGSYRVVTADLEQIGARALDRAMDGPSDIIMVDEVGPMEMTSPSFRGALSRVLGGEQPTVATLKIESQYPEVENIRRDSIRLEINKTNREDVYRKLIEQVDDWTDRLGS